MTDYTKLQSRCQRGEPSLADANNLLAECYGALGKLMAEKELLLRAGESLTDQIKQLKAENESLRKDAERYRFLRCDDNDKVLTLDARVDDHVECLEHLFMDDLDSAIDDLMSKGDHS